MKYQVSLKVFSNLSIKINFNFLFLGSPFISYVVNPEKVKIIGGLHSLLDHYNTLNLQLYEERLISFDTSEAGPGTFCA